MKSRILRERGLEMRKKVIIFCFLAALVCGSFIFVYFSFQKVTLNEILVQNDFDINRVEKFEIFQDSYNWYKTETTRKNITDIKNVINYFGQIDSIKMRVHKPLFKKSEYFFDYYNYISQVFLKCSYEDKILIIEFHNTDFGVCNIIAYNDGEINRYRLYFESFEDFLISN